MDSPLWREKIHQFKIPIALSLLGLVLIIGGIFASGLDKQKPKSFPKESLVENQKTISVDVSGSVQIPGVYKLKEGQRIEDAVAAAGGFSQDVNTEYISKYLNMAQRLSDGSKVYVPAAGEQPARNASSPDNATPLRAGASVAGGGMATVNINNATQAQLEALPGIGPVTASKIISDRQYQQIEDLLSRKVVSKAVFEKIKGQIVVY